MASLLLCMSGFEVAHMHLCRCVCVYGLTVFRFSLFQLYLASPWSSLYNEMIASLTTITRLLNFVVCLQWQKTAVHCSNCVNESGSADASSVCCMEINSISLDQKLQCIFESVSCLVSGSGMSLFLCVIKFIHKMNPGKSSLFLCLPVPRALVHSGKTPNWPTMLQMLAISNQ